MNRTYSFHWRDGKVSTGEGATPEDAFSALGYGAGAVAALDYYEEAVEGENLVCGEGI